MVYTLTSIFDACGDLAFLWVELQQIKRTGAGLRREELGLDGLIHAA